jgi:DNA-binding transcriptional ArsR family regulator
MKDQLSSEKCSKYLRALADPERLRIIQCLEEGPLIVGELCKRLHSPLANVSHHLKQLRIAGLVINRKQGRSVIYTLSARLLEQKKTASSLNVLDFGCCRLELGQKVAEPDAV